MTELKPSLFSLDELGAPRVIPARVAPEREPPPKEPRVFYEDEHVQLWHGRWQDVVPRLGQVDAVITDPPYSERTHSGGHSEDVEDGCQRRHIDYAAWSESDVREAVPVWTSRCRGWSAVLTDHVLSQAFEQELVAARLYCFAPLPCVVRGSRVRLCGDGPSSITCWLRVARPGTLSRWGTLPGAYDGPREAQGRMGGKPLWLMRAIVSDYSRGGNVILDPCAGAGTTGRAAKDLGRRAILIEQDRRTCELAAKVLRPARAWQQDLATDEAEGTP